MSKLILKTNLSNVFQPSRIVFASSKKPFSIANIKSIKIENYDLKEEKARIEAIIGKKLSSFDVEDGGKQPQKITLKNEKLTVVCDFGVLIRDDLNKTLKSCIVQEGDKTFLNIASLEWDGTLTTATAAIAAPVANNANDNDY